MDKITSNKGLFYTLVATAAILVILNIMHKDKNQTQQQKEVIKPKPDISEKDYATISTKDSIRTVIVLTLNMPKAKLTTKPLNGAPVIAESGTYTQASDFVTVLLAYKDGEKMQSPKDLTFTKHKDGSLVLLNPEQEGYSNAGLTLGAATAKELNKTSWVWTQTQMNDEVVIKPSDPSNFKLTFNDGDTISTTTDCNNGAGNYYIAGNKIAFGPIAATKKYCKNSIEDRYFANLGAVERYKIEGNKLIMMFPFDSGSMVFEKATK